MRKKTYINPEMDVIRFDADDVITASGTKTGNSGGIVLPDDEW